MRWENLWPFAHTLAGWIAASVTIGLTIFHGTKRVLETYDWYMYRFVDHKVKDALDASVIPARLTAVGEEDAKAVAKSVPELSELVKMSQKRVLASLKRLKRADRVTQTGDKWKAVL